jgi:hypothetical protein
LLNCPEISPRSRSGQLVKSSPEVGSSLKSANLLGIFLWANMVYSISGFQRI